MQHSHVDSEGERTFERTLRRSLGDVEGLHPVDVHEAVRRRIARRARARRNRRGLAVSAFFVTLIASSITIVALRSTNGDPPTAVLDAEPATAVGGGESSLAEVAESTESPGSTPATEVASGPGPTATSMQENSPAAPSYTAIVSLAGEDLLIDDRAGGAPRLIDLPPQRSGFDRLLYSDESTAIVVDGGRVLAASSDGTVTAIVEDAFSLGPPEQNGLWVGNRPNRAGSTDEVDWHWTDYAGVSSSSRSFSLPIGALPFAGAEGWLAVIDRASGEILFSVNDKTISLGRGSPLSGSDLAFSFVDDEGQVVLVDVQTGDSRRMNITESQRPASTLQSADYSSDGSKLALMMRNTDDEDSPAKLVLLDLVTNTYREVLTIDGGSVVRWVDGEQVMVTGLNAPALVNVATGAAQEVGLPSATQAVPLFD